MLCVVVFVILFRVSISMLRDFADCHDDFDLKPKDGMLKDHTFTWLAVVQYIHVTTGLPHHSKAPRVTLVHKNFGIGTAVDLLRLPKNYRLGNMIFGDYERDEEDCKMTITQIKMGLHCNRAYLEMPIIDIVPHPEFTRFGVGNSLALVRLLRPLASKYMVPICFPSELARERIRSKRMVFLVDYSNTVPKDFEGEKLAKKTLKLFTHRECRKQRMRSRLGSEGVTHVLCTSGCGVRSGAPIVYHAVDGPFELIGVSSGGSQCARRESRRRLNPNPPVYIDIFPYVQWITNVVTAHVMPRPYPEAFQLTSEDSDNNMIVSPTKNILRQKRRPRKYVLSGWRSRTYVSGKVCFSRPSRLRRLAFFYDERFEVNADPPAKLTVFIKILVGPETKIRCVKMLLPNRLKDPIIEGVGRYNISIEFRSDWFPYTYYFSIYIYGKNSSFEEEVRWQYEKDYHMSSSHMVGRR